MKKKTIVILVCILFFAGGINFAYSQSGLLRFVRIVQIIRDVGGYLRTIQTFTRGSTSGTVAGYIPHNFPFGGHILTSERACSFRFWIWTYICYGPLGCWQTPCPNCGYIPLGGRAISVGPPIATPGRVITFPFISDIYRNHSENRVGPWALGLGFTPFPLGEINDALDALVIPPGGPCALRAGPPYVPNCFDNFHFSCVSSGDEFPNGDPIYKVIRKLGTGP